MAHRTAKAVRRQRERALEPLPVVLRAPTAQELKVARALRELHQVPLPGQAAQLRALLLPAVLQQARDRAQDPLARALVKALEREQALRPTRRRRGLLRARPGPARTRRS